MVSRVTTAVLLLICLFNAHKALAQEEEGLGFLSFDSAPPEKVSCPNMRIISDFKLDQYMGRWYELERFDVPFQTGDCGTVDYYPDTNKTFSLVKTEVSKGKPVVTKGTAVATEEGTRSRFYVTLPDIPEGDGSPNYNVVATDYKTFAVIYTCVPLGFNDKLEFAWIMGRREKLPDKFLIIIKKWIQKFGIDVKNFSRVNQANCIRTPYSSTQS
ncbi:apolipoprotein D-like [Macrobrachium rosenbergii]|uniref:apolipoprotein D-like n=1 Tax=Macrobrachium rosenbergii TaxID=79674 RepID=UPI0034D69BFB